MTPASSSSRAAAGGAAIQWNIHWIASLPSGSRNDTRGVFRLSTIADSGARAFLGAVCAIVVGIFPASALAQGLDYGSFERLFGEPVTTSVTGSPQRASQVAATMEIVTQEEIRRSGAKDIPGVLRHVTGVNVLRWTNDHADVSVRGYNKAFSSRLLVLINGRQVYADHYGYTPWSTLPVELSEIRQIEVVKGPNSALFGFNAVGGVINIITYSPLHDDVNFGIVRGGTQDYIEGSAGVTVSLGDGHGVRITGGGRQNDDFSTPLEPVNVGTRRGEERASVRLDAHFTLRPNIEFEIESSYTKADQVSMAPNYTMGYEEMTTKSVKGRLSADTDFGIIHATLYRNWIDNDVFAGTLDETVADFHNRVTVVQLEDIFKLGADHTVRVSGEYRHSELDTTPFEGGHVHYEVYSGGAMWNWTITSSLTLNNAVRVDSLDLGRKGAIPAGFGLSNDDWERTLTEVSFNSGLGWQVSANDTLRLTAARGAQLPNLFNLGGSLFAIPIPPGFGLPPTIFIAGVPTLKPTTVTNYEFAWDREFPTYNASLRSAVFYGVTRDIVADSGGFLFEAAIFSAPANIGKSEAIGFEISLDGTFLEHWRWGLGYIYEDVDDKFMAGFTPDLTLISFEETTPEHIVNANLGWARGPWQIDAYLRYQSEFANPRAGDFITTFNMLVPISDYVTVDARIAFEVVDGITLEVSGQNLLSEEQRQTSGPKVERRVLGAIRADF